MQDTLDYEEGASLEPGLATGPVLYAAEEHPQLQELIERNFTEEGDIELVRSSYPMYGSISYFTPGYSICSSIIWD
jgi:geranylgeranyl pyrophosphate synthase